MADGFAVIKYDDNKRAVVTVVTDVAPDDLRGADVDRLVVWLRWLEQQRARSRKV